MKKKVPSSFETSGRNHPTSRRDNPEELLAQYEHMFEINKIFQRFVIFSGQSGKLPATVAYLSLQYCLSFSLVNTSDKEVSCCYRRTDFHLSGRCAQHSTLPSRLSLLMANLAANTPFP